MAGGGAKGGPTFSSNASPSRRSYNPLVLVSLPSSCTRAPRTPPGYQSASLSRAVSRARARTRAHARTHASTSTGLTREYTHTHTHIQLHAHRGETFLGSILSLSSSCARWKINIGKPGSSGRASTATSVQAPSRYHPYSSPFSRCASPLPVNPLAVPLLR